MAFHPPPVDLHADQDATTPHIPHAKNGDGVQKRSDTIKVVEFLLGDEHLAVDLFLKSYITFGT